MAASARPGRNFGTTNRVETLRLRLVAGELGRRVGERIREARLEKGINQRQLANLIPSDAIDNQRISDWERAVNQPNDANMRAIAEALDKPVAWFYSEQDKPAATPDLMGALTGSDDVVAVLRQLDARLETLEATVAGLAEALVAALPQAQPARRQSAGS